MDLRLGFFFLCTAVSPVVGEPGVSLSPGGILVVTFECQTLGGTNRNEDRRNIEFNIENKKCESSSTQVPWKVKFSSSLEMQASMNSTANVQYARDACESKYREDVR